MSRRAWAWGVPAAVLVLTGLGWLYATSTPRYALYRLGVAVQQRDVAAAERYFDVERIADSATEVIVADYLARQPAPTTTAESFGRQVAGSIVKRRVRPQVVTRVRLEIRRSVERAGIQSAALVLPVGAVAVFQDFEVVSDGPDVWVAYRDPKQGPVRFRMSRQADRGWQISEFDPDWVRRRAREEPARIR
jgi:Protein of unknown function (DUF2939)